MSTITEMSPTEIQSRLDEVKDEYKNAGHRLAVVGHQGSFSWKFFPVRTGFGGQLFVAETVSSADRFVVCASEDGKPFVTELWHRTDPIGKPYAGETVYVERWQTWPESKREFHGYVDSVSRELVQAG